MSMAVLILLLLAGGLLAWQSERINPNLPRWVALISVVISLVFVLLSLPPDQAVLVPDPGSPNDWMLYLKVDWVPRFGIAIELAMDGLSLLLVVLTLLLGLVAVASSWSEIDFKPGLFQANLVWTLAGVCGVGTREQNLCGNEVLHLYPGFRPAYAGGDRGAGLAGPDQHRSAELQLS